VVRGAGADRGAGMVRVGVDDQDLRGPGPMLHGVAFVQ
jgi:hypothetical protein